MRILCDASVLELPKTGIGNVLVSLYASCLKLNPTLQATALHRDPLKNPLPSGMLDSRIAASLSKKWWRRIAIPWKAFANHFDIVHFPSNGAIPTLLSPSLQRVLPRNFNPLIVATMHDILPLRIPGYLPTEEARQRYLYKVQRDINRADLLITDSEFSRKDISNHFQLRSDPIVIYPATSLSDVLLEEVPGIPDRDFFLYVGGYSPRKGLVQFLRVFLELTRQRILTSPLVLAGLKLFISDEFSDLVKEGAEMGVVREIGHVSDGQLRSLYSKALALVYPSKYEGFGLPPLEAMTLGCPVITTSETSLPEVCANAAIYIDPDKTPEFAAALVSIETNANLREDLICKGRAQATRFTWANSAKAFMRHLEEAQKIR